MPTELVVNGKAVGAVAAESYSDSHYQAASTTIVVFELHHSRLMTLGICTAVFGLEHAFLVGYCNKLSDVRISRLEKLVEAQNVIILEFKKDFDVLKDTVRSQNIKINNLENQLQSCKACFDLKDPNTTSVLLSQHILPSRDKMNVETPQHQVGVEINRLQKDFKRDRRLLLSGSNVDFPPIIAFHAYLSKSEIDPGHHHTIIFYSVLSNSGNGYNNHSGTFIAPENGMYVFAFTVVGYPGSRMPVQLIVNSNIVGATATDSLSDTPYTSVSSIFVVYLNQSDTCFLRTAQTTGSIVGNLYSSDWSRSSFSAWKL